MFREISHCNTHVPDALIHTMIVVNFHYLPKPTFDRQLDDFEMFRDDALGKFMKDLALEALLSFRHLTKFQTIMIVCNAFLKILGCEIASDFQHLQNIQNLTSKAQWKGARTHLPLLQVFALRLAPNAVLEFLQKLDKILTTNNAHDARKQLDLEIEKFIKSQRILQEAYSRQRNYVHYAEYDDNDGAYDNEYEDDDHDAEFHDDEYDEDDEYDNHDDEYDDDNHDDECHDNYDDNDGGYGNDDDDRDNDALRSENQNLRTQLADYDECLLRAVRKVQQHEVKHILSSPLVVVIAISKYKSQNNLPTVKNDWRRTSTLFSKHYGWDVIRNKGNSVDKYDAKGIIKFAKNKLKHCRGKYDSVILIWSGHGDTNNVQCSEKNELISRNWLYSQFNSENCPSMKNKLKLFVMDACRVETDGKRWCPRQSRNQNLNRIVLYPNTDGQVTIAGNNGSYLVNAFIDSMKTNLNSHRKELSISNILDDTKERLERDRIPIGRRGKSCQLTLVRNCTMKIKKMQQYGFWKSGRQSRSKVRWKLQRVHHTETSPSVKFEHCIR